MTGQLNENKEYNITNGHNKREQKKEQQGQCDKSVKTNHRCTDPCVLCKREGKKVGGSES